MNSSQTILQSPSNINGGISNSSLDLANPYNLLVFLVFYSPIILSTCVFSMSFLFQNFKGFIYLGILLAVIIIREFILKFSGAKNVLSSNPICNMVQYSKYGNSGFSVFVLSFTILYICWPMIINNDMNYFILSALLFYLILDISLRYTKGCLKNATDIFINMLTGALSGTIIPFLMYVGGSSKYLFFNEISSNKEVCSLPKKQQFKCAVYKNGQLIGNTSG